MRTLFAADPARAARVLARAVCYHLDDRVILNGRRTVVFTDRATDPYPPNTAG